MNPRTILIVEDEVDCASILEVALEALPGISVLRVANAELALECSTGRDLGAVVSDVQLPGKSGLDLIAGVRGVPVVIVSASTDPHMEEQALRLGAAAFFSKPFSPSAVCEKVRELLEGV